MAMHLKHGIANGKGVTESIISVPGTYLERTSDENDTEEEDDDVPITQPVSRNRWKPVTDERKRYIRGPFPTAVPAPQKPRLMMIGMSPGEHEKKYGLSFYGSVSQDFLRQIENNLTIEIDDRLYATNYCKYALHHSCPKTIKSYFGQWLWHVLKLEIWLVQPDIIIVTPIGRLKQNLIKFLNIDPVTNTGRIPVATFGDRTTEEKDVKVLFIPFKFSQAVRESIQAFYPAKVAKKEIYQVDYEVVHTAERLRQILEEHAAATDVAVDCEWEGQHYVNSRAYLRSIQLAFRPDYAYIIELTNEEGQETFNDPKTAARLLDEFLNQNITILGSFFYTDNIWLKAFGVHCWKKYLRLDPPEILDAAMAVRAVNEDASLDLCNIIRRYYPIDRWDRPIEEFKKSHGKASFGCAPAEILYPYAAKDVAYLILIKDKLRSELSCDIFQQDCWSAYKQILKACAVLMEMMDTGVTLDINLYETLHQKFTQAYNKLLEELRQEINWPDFNPRKPSHRLEFLFGDAFVQKPQRPKEAITLNLNPGRTVTTASMARTWEELDEKQQQYAKPSTNKVSCGILASADPRARKLYNLTILDQALKTVFGKNGLRSHCCTDGKIRSFLSPTLKTGRISSSRPNLQNLSKRRDEEYSKLLGEPTALRKMLIPQRGNVMIMADLVSAELVALAIMSNDSLLWEHCERAAKPENDPQYFDIHSNLAVKAFRLQCPPNKKGLAEIGKSHLRTVAKAIVYGANYGRTDKAILKELESQGINIKEEEVAVLREEIRNQYHKAHNCLESLMMAPHTRDFIRTPFGRCKRFTAVRRQADKEQQGREASNFPFQSVVADVMINLMYELWRHPLKERLGYRLVLPIHDEVWIEVPEENADQVIAIMQEIISNIKLASWTLDGKLRDRTGKPVESIHDLTADDLYQFSLDVKKFKPV